MDTPTLIFSQGDGKKSILVNKSRLIIVNGPGKGTEFQVDKDVFTVGSGQVNDLRIDDATVSRRHCEIRVVPNGYVVRDLGSTNGTIINGVKIVEAFLEKGMELAMGQIRLLFYPIMESREYILSNRESFGRLLGKSLAIRHLFHQAESYAPSEATILIEGETGCGKEVLAEEIHNHSKRSSKPFIVIDCATLAKDLIESELFGHSKGSFTGASTDRTGALEQANGGTVFLDEIGELSLDLQPKLLRFLEKKEIKRVGSNSLKTVDVRVICATNRKLENEVNAGRFREDLFYRISVVKMEMPPLRRRKEDVPVIVKRFLENLGGDRVMEEVEDFDRSMQELMNYDWPGNVRELRNIVEIAYYNSKRPIIIKDFLYANRFAQTAPAKPQHKEVRSDQPFKVAKETVIRDFEKVYIEDILKKNDGNISKAAREADIERVYLQRLVKKYDISR